MGKARHGTAAGGPGTGDLRQSVKVGKLNLVDLAGSERVHITGATGKAVCYHGSYCYQMQTGSLLAMSTSLVLQVHLFGVCAPS